MDTTDAEKFGVVSHKAILGYADYCAMKALDKYWHPARTIEAKSCVVALGDPFFECFHVEQTGGLMRSKIKTFFPEYELDPQQDYAITLRENYDATECIVSALNSMTEHDTFLVGNQPFVIYRNYKFVAYPEKVEDGFKIWVGLSLPAHGFNNRGFLHVSSATRINVKNWGKMCNQLRVEFARKIADEHSWTSDLPNSDGTFARGVRLYHVATRSERGKSKSGYLTRLAIAPEVSTIVPQIAAETSKGEMLVTRDPTEKYKWVGLVTDALANYANWQLGYNHPSCKYHLEGWGDDQGYWIAAIERQQSPPEK